MLDSIEICYRFNETFQRTYATQLCGGADEPLYLPPTHLKLGLIQYNRNFAASALHEIAHWLIAGRRRRQLVDYGYAYQSEPRTNADQKRFYLYEARNQGLEKMLSQQCGNPFQVSVDNLLVGVDERNLFGDSVTTACRQWRERVLPIRVQRMLCSLGE